MSLQENITDTQIKLDLLYSWFPFLRDGFKVPEFKPLLKTRKSKLFLLSLIPLSFLILLLGPLWIPQKVGMVIGVTLLSTFFLLLPFSRIIKKVISVTPLPIILLVVFWPLILLYIFERFLAKTKNIRQTGMFVVLISVVEKVLEWFSLMAGIILLVTVIILLFI
jgi:hypothetical protein